MKYILIMLAVFPLLSSAEDYREVFVFNANQDKKIKLYLDGITRIEPQTFQTFIYSRSYIKDYTCTPIRGGKETKCSNPHDHKEEVRIKANCIERYNMDDQIIIVCGDGNLPWSASPQWIIDEHL